MYKKISNFQKVAYFLIFFFSYLKQFTNTTVKVFTEFYYQVSVYSLKVISAVAVEVSSLLV